MLPMMRANFARGPVTPQGRRYAISSIVAQFGCFARSS